MTVAGFRVLDADAHVVEPAEVFAAWTDDPVPADLPVDTPLVPCGDFDLVADQFARQSEHRNACLTKWFGRRSQACP